MAGEGCFSLKPRKGRGEGGISVHAELGVRADDVLILEEIQRAFGGKIHAYQPAKDPNPIMKWTAASKRDLARLVEYFDEFGLRSAKKARDYAIWRLAVKAYCASGRRAPELPALHAALVQCRRFNGEPIALPESPQLRLVAHG
jgi:hypothetical protein